MSKKILKKIIFFPDRIKRFERKGSKEAIEREIEFFFFAYHIDQVDTNRLELSIGSIDKTIYTW